MRKILLASTALIAMTSVSAMASDITISGSHVFKYTADDKQKDEAESTTVDGSSLSTETDVTIKFSNTTDSGISTTLTYGFDESGGADDINATISGDFGTIYLDDAGDDTAIGGFDEAADMAGEGDDTGMSTGYRGGIMGTTNTVGYKFPSLVENLDLAVNVGDSAAGEYFGYGIGYSMMGVELGYVVESTGTVENTSISLGASFGDISVGVDQIDYDSDTDTSDRETSAYGVSYALGDITLAYEIGSMDDGDGTEIENHSQIAASYAIATGITGVITTSEIDSTTDTDDQDALELQIKLSF